MLIFAKAPAAEVLEIMYVFSDKGITVALAQAKRKRLINVMINLMLLTNCFWYITSRVNEISYTLFLHFNIMFLQKSVNS